MSKRGKKTKTDSVHISGKVEVKVSIFHAVSFTLKHASIKSQNIWKWNIVCFLFWCFSSVINKYISYIFSLMPLLILSFSVETRDVSKLCSSPSKIVKCKFMKCNYLSKAQQKRTSHEVQSERACTWTCLTFCCGFWRLMKVELVRQVFKACVFPASLYP